MSPVVSSSEDQTDEFQFPWKQREILTFDIPVHDSERAGLGVSVKGKTSTSKGKQNRKSDESLSKNIKYAVI
jgi:partitioning defective protein 3